MKKSDFEKLVQEGIKQIPEKFRKKLSNVAIVIEESPSQRQLKKLKLPEGSILFGLYEGIPQTKRGLYYGALPDKITIFKKPIEEIGRARGGICQIVKNTIWHEIAHHFGIGEKGIREIELRRRKFQKLF